MDDLVPIGEFAQKSGLSQKRLRTYAAAGLLQPASVDSSSGYRYYAPDQLRTARLIDVLREAGLPLAEIAEVLRDPSSERLDTWAQTVEIDARQRRQALDIARDLLAAEPSSVRPVDGDPVRRICMTWLNAVSLSEVGRVRENNEDAVMTSDRLAVVADGMGGHPGGEVAAKVAVSLVQAAYTGRSIDELEAAVRAANRAIWDRASANEDLEG
ncbi:MAG TPA: MerR family transcriptional regulator, partial [Ilumatobacteraceae bacterium]|nr:MerR family transcriptional regulator [Ilumatobacteraceae bacterium]